MGKACLTEKKPKIMRVVNFSRFAALLVAGLGFSSVPAAAQWCGGCYAPPVVVQPVYSGCGCCSCGSAYYGGYGYGGYGGYYGAAYAAYGYGYGYGYGDYVAPRIYARARWGARYWGPRRGFARY